MIKLIKILGSSTNIPTIEERPIANYVTYLTGNVYYSTPYGINADPFQSDTEAKFVITEGIEEGDPKRTVKGFMATPDMIFEADVLGADSLNFRDKITLVQKEQGLGFTHVNTTPGNGAEVYDTADANSGKILIRLAF